MCAAAYYSQQRESVPVSKLLSIWRCRHTLMWWASEGLIYIIDKILFLQSRLLLVDGIHKHLPPRLNNMIWIFMDTSVREKTNKLLS